MIALGLSSRTAFDYAGPPIVLLFITIAAFHVLRIYRRSALLRRARFEFIRRLPPARQPAAIARVLTKPLHYDRDDGRKAISMFLAEHGQFGVAYRLQLRPQAAVSPVVAGFEPVAKGDLSAHWLADVAGSHAANPAPRNAPARALWIAWACFGFGALVLVVVPVLMLINMSRSGIAIVPARLVVMTAICATLWTALALFAAILSESWFVVPSGLVRRRLNRLTGRVSLQVFPRPLSVLVLTQHSKRHWAVRVRTGNVNGIFSASDVEATAILRAWLCHASMPTIERVREALG
ncbi:MAG: hypothetical protein ACKVS9_16350 [Phycisphaerae bacterium]